MSYLPKVPSMKLVPIGAGVEEEASRRSASLWESWFLGSVPELWFTRHFESGHACL